MKKLLFFIIIAYLILLQPKYVQAVAPVSEPSAQIHMELASERKTDHRANILKGYLTIYHSPLVNYCEKIVTEADKYRIPWTWIVAISGVESTFGQAIPPSSYNGWGWANGTFAFKNWDDGIETVSKSLREEYLDKGADTVDKIAPIYAPPSTTWAGKVAYFIGKIESFSDQNIHELPISL